MRENIAIQLVARDDEISLEEAGAMWNTWKLAAKRGHFGDCTNEPETCSKCLVDRTYKDADQIRTLISEEIEKVENPYMEQTRDGECNIYPDFGIFEECRQKILALLR